MSRIIFHPIDEWLFKVRLYISQHDPEILPYTEMYLGEASFGRKYIDNDLQHLNLDSEIVEIGAGSMLLSCQLAREGYNVTAIEPIGSGFSHFDRMQKLILELAKSDNCVPRIINKSVEVLTIQNVFDYAFSINVMEHVEDVSLALSKVGESLKNNAIYRFTCPNYLFPYEPHFNCPTLFSKSLTGKIFKNKLLLNKNLPDPLGTWQSLNWINILQIRSKTNKIPGLQAHFNRRFLISTFERITDDIEFAKRRSNWMCIVIKGLVKIRLHYIIWLIPLLIQPTIDCKIKKVLD